MLEQPIKTSLKLVFNSKDITASLVPDLLGFTYEDKETLEADEISISLKDIDGKWASRWRPNGGETITAFITQGTTDRKKKTLNCGKYFMDSIRASGSPRVVELRAVSVPLDKPIRRRIKSRAWEKKSFKSIAQVIADEANVQLLFDSNNNPEFDRVDQARESDLKLLLRLCEENGLSLKLTDEKLVIYDQEYYESRPPVKTIVLGKSNILSWDFEASQSETYKSVTVSYRDPKKKVKGEAGGYNMDLERVKAVKVNSAVLTYTYTDPLADSNGQEYNLKKRATSLAEAKRFAKAKLRELNKRSVTGSMSLIGDVELVAGAVIRVQGFGSFDANYFIESASHEVSGSGYVSSISIRRVNNKY